MASNTKDDRVTEARLAAIVDSSFDAIISKDLDGNVKSWNRAAVQYFGYSAEEMIGKSIRILIPADHQDEEDAILARIRRGEVVESFETQRLTKSGDLIFVSLTVSPIKDATGRIVGASKIVRDITATKENERRIRILLREVNHRVKNQYAVIQSIIRETAKRAESVDSFASQINSRISSLASSHDLLVATDWRGAYLGTLIEDQLRPFGHDGLVHLSGPLLNLAPHAVLNIGMAIYELATNSAKYGVFATSEGTIAVTWRVLQEDEKYLSLTWSETDNVPGDAVEDKKQRTGFGSIVLFRVAPSSLNGTSTFTREGGLRIWELKAPLDQCLREKEEG
ncbi:sensor histidine kinase [Phyllobacterium myrsinacearum]|uniref:Blue-light-activated histidine kinase n=1 Tax=Phyllobacterium myrsinacearum TaxID=28101 RepID=A0A839EDX6_9HYPH|nr:PAS domain S-box-containing protein [Phyllobacterium myrsinacearum]